VSSAGYWQSFLMSQLNSGRARSQRARIGYITPRISDENGLAMRGVLVRHHLTALRETFPEDLLAECCFYARGAADVLVAEGRTTAVNA
jgi:hypothetical protein